MLPSAPHIQYLTEQEKSPFVKAQDEATRRICEAAYIAVDTPWRIQSGTMEELPRWLITALESIGGGHSSNPFFLGSYMTTQGFLEQLYDSPVGVEQSRTISDVFAWINNTLLYGAFQECDELLQRVQVDRLSYPVVLSFLTFTFAARDQLRERRSLYERIWKRVAAERGHQAAEHLLKTLT